MPDIILPTRVKSLTTRRRSVNAPTAADVPTVDPAVARDPGLTVPSGAFGGGIGEGLETLGDALSGVSEDVRKAMERQQRRTDSLETAKGIIATDKQYDQEVERIRLAEDLTDGDLFVRSGALAADIRSSAEQSLPKHVSDDARAGFSILLQHQEAKFNRRIGTLHLRAQESRAVALVTDAGLEAADAVRRDPGLLADRLDLIDDAVTGSMGVLSNADEARLLREQRAILIEAALTGLAEKGLGDEATKILDDGEFDGDLSQHAIGRLKTDLDRIAREAGKVESARVASLIEADIASRAATGRGDADLTEDRVQAAGGGEAGSIAVEQYRDRRAMAETSHQARQDFQAATPEEMNAIVAGAIPKPGDANFDDQARRSRILAAERDRQLQLRQRDPATAAMQIPAIGALFEPAPGEEAGDPDFDPGEKRLAALRLRIEAQTAIGIARPRLLTRAEAGRIADRLTTMADGRVAAFQDLKQTYGDLYPALLTELGDRKFGGLPPRLRLQGSVTGSDAPPVLARELDQALTTGRGGSDITRTDDDPAGIASKVQTLLAPMLPDDGDPDTSRQNQALADAAIALARHRIAKGENPETAAEFAVDDLTGTQAVRDDFSLFPDPADDNVLDTGPRQDGQENDGADDVEFDDEELLTDDEPDQFENKPKPSKRPSRTESGPDSFILAEMSPEELEGFRDVLNESIEENTVKLRALNDEMMALQRKEDPIRKEVKELGEKIRINAGEAANTIVVGLLLTRNITPIDVMNLAELSKDLSKFFPRLEELVIAHKETMKIRKGEGKQIGEDALREFLNDRWLRKREVEAELEARKSEEPR